MDFTLTNKNSKAIEFRFIASGAPFGRGAINQTSKPLWEIVSNDFILGQWFIEDIAKHEDGEGWCLDGGNRQFDLDASLASVAKEKSIQALTEGGANK